MASPQYECSYGVSNHCSGKILLHTPCMCVASPQYERAYAFLSECSVKTLLHTPDKCMASPQCEYAYVCSSYCSLRTLLHTAGICTASPQYECAYVFSIYSFLKIPLHNGDRSKDSFLPLQSLEPPYQILQIGLNLNSPQSGYQRSVVFCPCTVCPLKETSETIWSLPFCILG